jgi:hypothetical protein
MSTFRQQNRKEKIVIFNPTQDKHKTTAFLF